MPRGGKRLGAGVKPTWKNGTTRTIRVPIAIAEKVLELARELDENGFVEHEIPSRVLNLSGVSIPRFGGKSFVSLQDLVVSGYEIKPVNLSKRLIEEIYKEEISRG